jgi:hypothetical protein
VICGRACTAWAEEAAPNKQAKVTSIGVDLTDLGDMASSTKPL